MTDQFEGMEADDAVATFLGYVEEIRAASEADLPTVLDSIRERSGDSPFLVGGSASVIADFFDAAVPKEMRPVLSLLIPQDTLGDLVKQALAGQVRDVRVRTHAMTTEERHELFDFAAEIFRWDEFGKFIDSLEDDQKKTA